jgi:hypothetical protein
MSGVYISGTNVGSVVNQIAMDSPSLGAFGSQAKFVLSSSVTTRTASALAMFTSSAMRNPARAVQLCQYVPASTAATAGRGRVQ